MNKILLHTPEGVRDIYSEECEKKLILQENLHQVLKLYGYQDIETPTFEFFDVFSKEVGTTSSKELYKFFDREGNTLVLRPDMTPSVARSAAKYFMDETMPIRFCYIGNTFTNNNSFQGRLKEVTQLGAELIGDSSVNADAEMIAMTIDSLKKAGLKDFQISVGQVDFFKGLLEEAGFEEESELELRELISNKNIFGIEELVSEQGISMELQQIFLKMPELFGPIEIVTKIKTLVKNPRALAAVERLEKLYQLLCLYGVAGYVSFDLGMVSKYRYYTGIIFNAYTYGTGEPIVKGGRYDTLLNHFGKQSPAIGFAIVVNQLMSALSRQKIETPLKSSTLLILYKETEQKEALSVTKLFRESGKNTEQIMMPEHANLETYKEFAKGKNIGTIYYFISEQKVQIVDVAHGVVRTAAIKELMSEVLLK